MVARLPLKLVIEGTVAAVLFESNEIADCESRELLGRELRLVELGSIASDRCFDLHMYGGQVRCD